MTVSRLLKYPITLVERVQDGEDSWGSPVYIDVETEALCYYRLMETTDADDGGAVVSQTIEVFLEPDVAIGPYSAVKLDPFGELEVIGQPAPELNARTGEVNHMRLTTKVAAP